MLQDLQGALRAPRDDLAQFVGEFWSVGSCRRYHHRLLVGGDARRVPELGDEWVALLPGHVPSLGEDLVHLWHRPSDRFVRLPFGVAGKGVWFHHLVSTAQGTVWGFDRDHGTIVDLGTLDELIALGEPLDEADRRDTYERYGDEVWCRTDW